MRVRPAIMIVMIIVVLLSACTAPEAGPSLPPTYAGPARARVELTSVPLDDGLEVHTVERATIVGDLAVLYGQNTSTVVDLTTGRRLGSPDGDDEVTLPDHRRAGIVRDDGMAADDGRGGLLFQGYYRIPCPHDARACGEVDTTKTAEQGVVARRLDANGRPVVWSFAAVPSTDRDEGSVEDVSLRVVLATADFVVITKGGDPTSGTTFTDSPARTWVLDTRTGRRLWTRQGVLPRAIDGSRLLVGERTVLTDGYGAPEILDARTGRIRWRGEADEPRLWWSAGAGLGVLVTVTEHTMLGDARLIDLATGDSLTATSVRSPQFVGLGRAGDTSLAAWTDRDQLLTWSPGDAKPVLAGDTLPPDQAVFAVAHGLVWTFGRTDGAGRAYTTTARDRTGAARSAALPGFPRLITDDYVITDERSTSGVLRIWRIR